MEKCKVRLSRTDERRVCVGHAWVTQAHTLKGKHLFLPGTHSLILLYNTSVRPFLILAAEFTHRPRHLSIKNHTVTYPQSARAMTQHCEKDRKQPFEVPV